jgi:hypothetical protein
MAASFCSSTKRPSETAAQLKEIADILALGLQRFLAQQSSRELPYDGESSLHISPDQSGDAAAWRSGEQQ